MSGADIEPKLASEVNLSTVERSFRTPEQEIALGDLQIRKNFATRIMVVFAIANIFVLIGLYVVFRQDGLQLAAGQVKATERIVDGKVIMALLGATTVQLGTVIYTITRAIFPSAGAGKGA